MAPYPYPLALPSSPAPAQTRFSIRRVTGVSESPTTGQQQVYEHPYALWTATVTLPAMKRDKAGEWQALFLMLRGRTGTFMLGDRDAKVPRGTARSASVISGTLGANTVQLATNGTLLNGDYIQIGSGGAARLHMVVGGGWSGNGTYTIEPPLKSNYGGGTAVTLLNPQGQFRMSTDDLGWDADAASIYGFSFACVESF